MALRSHIIYLYCLWRKSEYVFIYEHAICNICVKIFSECVERNDYCFQIMWCILCIFWESLQACVKSLMVRFHIFSIDEGDVYEVMSLKFLFFLQNMLNPVLQVQDLFNQAFRTKSYCHWTVSQRLRHLSLHSDVWWVFMKLFWSASD